MRHERQIFRFFPPFQQREILYIRRARPVKKDLPKITSRSLPSMTDNFVNSSLSDD